METLTADDYTVPPFPQGIKKIEIPKISLAKLLSNDDVEAKSLFNTCTRTGFFYLDLMDHPKGRKLWEAACLARKVGTKAMESMTMEEKDKFALRPDIGILDRGVRDENGQPKYVESINLPRDELFSPTPSEWQLPNWLQPYEDQFKAVMREGNTISNIIFGILEKELQLPSGTFTSCHRLNEPSHSFMRVLRYPRLEKGKTIDKPRFFAHRDLVSIAILFTWLTGLQIPKEDPEYSSPGVETEESWRWVEPLPGCAVVNLGDAMSIFTNDKLKSGRHRVVTPYGDQAQMDRCTVLCSTRPTHPTLMKAVKSPLIPKDLPEQADKQVQTAEAWGDACFKKFVEVNVIGAGA